MVYLKIRRIEIDVVSDDPFVSIFIDKVITHPDGSIKQTIGEFDRIYQKASSIPVQLAASVADDGVIDGLELFQLVAGAAYIWVISKHGGSMIDGRLVIEP